MLDVQASLLGKTLAKPANAVQLYATQSASTGLNSQPKHNLMAGKGLGMDRDDLCILFTFVLIFILVPGLLCLFFLDLLRFL